MTPELDFPVKTPAVGWRQFAKNWAEDAAYWKAEAMKARDALDAANSELAPWRGLADFYNLSRDDHSDVVVGAQSELVAERLSELAAAHRARIEAQP